MILQTSLTAAHCAKTLVASASTGNPTLRQCVRLLIPALVEFIAKMVPLVNEGSITEPQAAAIGEIWKAFSIFFNNVSEDLRECFLSFTLFLKLIHTTQAHVFSVSYYPLFPSSSSAMVWAHKHLAHRYPHRRQPSCLRMLQPLLRGLKRLLGSWILRRGSCWRRRFGEQWAVRRGHRLSRL